MGGELTNLPGNSEKAIPTMAKVYIDGDEISPTIYNIKGYNYFKLRDIAKALDFKVD